MPSLFLKIFLWFCFTIVISMVTMFAFTSTLRSGPPVLVWQSHMIRFFTLLGQYSIDTYFNSGSSGLLEYKNRIDNSLNIQSFLIDEELKECSGNMLPDTILHIARLSLISGKTEFKNYEKLIIGKPIIAVPFTAKNGKRYVFAGRVPYSIWDFISTQPVFQSIRFLTILICTFLLCYCLARYLTNPIRSIQAASRRIAAGDLSVRISHIIGNRRDELADLTKDFDRMAERIEALIMSQRSLIRDISHELRSPLTRLHLALALARKSASPETFTALDRIELEADRLNQLIQQLLTISRIEMEMQTANMPQVNLTDLIGEITSDAHFEAQSRGCSVEVIFRPPEDVHIQGNRDLLKSAIENVVRNAIRYTAEGTTVTINLDVTEHEGSSYVSLQVQDKGHGVPDQFLERIFHPFFRVDNARDRKTGGMGIGLAITERAVRLHGGKVKAFNETNKGLVVEMLFPQSI
ncbi:MAG: HAMP domain-containing protein [Desulfobacterales bacterium]|nr:HAMP domain-containing protein [Desulfobacterales bacterium]